MAKAKTSELHKRDNGKCGIHVGGCGLDVNVSDATRDELIPQSYFRSETGKKLKNNWFGEWNTQVMHRKCNDEKAGHTVEPRFRCICHMSYIDVEMNVLRVLYNAEGETWEDNTVAENVIGAYNEFGLLPGRFKRKGGGISHGVVAPGFISPKSKGVGFYLPRHTEYMAHKYNMRSMIERHPDWPSVVLLIVQEAKQAGSLPMSGDGYFRFNTPINGTLGGPVLTFAVAIAEAHILADRKVWLAIDGGDGLTGLSYHWQPVPEIEDANIRSGQSVEPGT